MIVTLVANKIFPTLFTEFPTGTIYAFNTIVFQGKNLQNTYFFFIFLTFSSILRVKVLILYHDTVCFAIAKKENINIVILKTEEINKGHAKRQEQIYTK